MRLKNTILLSVILCIGGIVLFFACRYTYGLKKEELKLKAREAFEKTLEEELKDRNVAGSFSLFFKSETLKVDMPDSVYLENENGRHRYRLDPVKNQMNITHHSNVRLFHSVAFWEKPIHLDSLNIAWKNHLMQLGVFAEPIVCVTLTNKDNSVKVLNKAIPEWCNVSYLMFTVYIGYACEIEVLGYIHYSFWNMMGVPVLYYLLICIVAICIIYKLSLFVQKRITQLLEKRTIEVPVIKVVHEVNNTPIRSYALRENIVFYAEKHVIKVGGIEKAIKPQVSHLLELFFQYKETDYILSDKIIIKNLWGEKYTDTTRLHKVINRLRSVLNEIDSSINIIRCINSYQLII